MATQRRKQTKATTATTKRSTPKRAKAPAKGKQAGVAQRYGCRLNSKVAVAASMFEEGAKMADVKKEIGITQYNFLSRMSARGHTVKKNDEGVITLVWNKDAA